MVEALSFRRDAHRRGGFTLIEVVIALAIFVFGALAIIRIFPPALGVIQNSGDRLTAVNLNRSVLAVYARQPGVVPDWIYDPNPGIGWRVDDNGIPVVGSVAGSPRRNNSIPSSSITDITKEFNESALGHFKNIVAERHFIPADGVVLSQFRFTGTPLIYQEDTVSGVTVDGTTGNLDFSKATKDSGPSNNVYVPASTDKIYVSYRWFDNGKLWGIEDELLASAGKVAQPTPLDGPVKMRIRQLITVTPAIDGRYGVIDFVSTPATGTSPAVLMLPAATIVSIDYSVEDWRWLVFDGVPTDNPRSNSTTSTQKSLNLPVKILDDQKSPSFVYTSLRSATKAPDNRESAAPGNSLIPSNFLSSSSSDSPPPNLRETRNGRIVFETSSFAGETPQARVVYWTADNWANQLSVAARSYLLNYKASAPSAEPWRDCSFEGNGSTPTRYIFFKPSEAGKTVLVSYSYNDISSGTPVEREINGRIVTIENIIRPEVVPIAVGNRVSRLELTDINGGSLAGSTITSIREIRGVSIQARTAWLDGNNFTQASSVGFREVNN